jgi:hypothetical protein
MKVLNEFSSSFCIYVVFNVQLAVLICLQFLRRSSEYLTKRKENYKLGILSVLLLPCYGLMAGMRMKLLSYYWILKVPSFNSDLFCATSPKRKSF